MTRKMLIDATHPEETRVAVVNGTKLEEYDYENITRKQIKSNIYLVKVTRVEPSLQAAFVDFGGNRHGFLPFPEIHPDYYRIPIADREALLAEERALAAAQAAQQDAEDEAELAASGETLEEEDDEDEDTAGEPARAPVARTAEIVYAAGEDEESDEPDGEDEDAETGDSAAGEEQEEQEEGGEEESGDAPAAAEAAPRPADLETVGGDVVETPLFRSALKRRYKIQEVIKRNQIMLVQINKEERGNKGAAVTSFISLPGRYCVLMPNSPRGGGVSRKVSSAGDRQRLKKILHELNVPEGMSVILRTAGVARSKAEIKRDLDYLLRLWDQIRELTLQSTAPALIYEEGNLIKRAIRDLYRREIGEVHVAGPEGHRTAHDFMKMLMPSHAQKVLLYADESAPLFTRHQVESQIDAIHSPLVHLKSGGYIVINPTEALVSIDVNSGRATKGRHIEETALKTNLEAADEIARQLRLRDLGGLVVIDFIDMEERRGNRTVEKRLRDAMQSDRARIQLGRISAFGLLELSRQRLNPSLVETNFETCKHCNGSGLVRTVETTGVIVLRAIEEEALRGRASEIRVTVPPEVALYIFNHKRDMLAALEKRHALRVFLHADDTLIKPAYNIEAARGDSRAQAQQPRRQAPVQTVDMSDLPEVDEEDAGADDISFAADDAGADAPRSERPERSERNDRRPRHERQGRRDGGGRGERGGRGGERGEPGPSAVAGEGGRGRRRGRRGGRRGGRGREGQPQGDNNNNNGNGGGEGGSHPQPRQEAAAAAPRPERQEDHHRQHDAPQQRVASGGGEAPAAAAYGGGSDAAPSAQGDRKGWWKRLTE